MNEALPDLVAHFHIKRGLFRRERVLDLVMEMPFDDIRADGITGLVTERRKHCSNFFYSVDFVELNDNSSSALSEKLKRIREVVLKKQTLKSRRSSGPASSIRQLA